MIFPLYRSSDFGPFENSGDQEWCEKRMEFVLLHGKPEKTKAMKAGCDRHVQLEEEVLSASHSLSSIEIFFRPVIDTAENIL